MKCLILIAFLTYTLGLFAAPVQSPQQVSDSQNFNFQNVRHVIAVGDIHGDYKALVKILNSTQIINKNNEWIGGDTHLALLGDLISGKEGSKKILDLVMSIESQAVKAGGKVHTLLGNHDLLVAAGNYSHMTKEERRQFLPKKSSDKKNVTSHLDKLFLKEGRYAQWIASRPMAIIINDLIYVHAGLDERALEYSLENLNRTTQDWVKYFQGNGRKPPKKSEWLVSADGHGPAYMRSYKITQKVTKNPTQAPKGGIDKHTFDAILNHFGAHGMSIAHAPTPESLIQFDHPYYGSKIISLDTRISDRTRGNMSAMEVNAYQTPKALYMNKITPTSTQRLLCKNLF